MLLSMTGFGEARHAQDGITVVVELRTINSRYFKLSLKCAEGYNSLESEIDSLVRSQVRRGAVQVAIRVDRTHAADEFKINQEVLASYLRQIDETQKRWQQSRAIPVESLLALPGVVADSPLNLVDAQSDWPLIREALTVAMRNLDKMRGHEGQAMAADLHANVRAMDADLAKIARRAPLVVEAYRARLKDRLQATLAEYQVTLDPTDLIKEVAIFAERSDISEEVVRLRSHVEQFDTLLVAPESSGRKLEFLSQEMLREANTIGSKANDVEIARHVIEIKAAIERIKEMIQNVE